MLTGLTKCKTDWIYC